MKPWTILLAALCVCGASASLARADADRPNILFFISDDLSAYHLGAYGGQANTPAIDRLAREGVRFDKAFCASPSCTPSRSALLTGQAIYRLEEGGQLMGSLPVKFPVFPLMLEKSGYFVGHTGKTWSPGNLGAGGWKPGTHPCGKGYEKRKNERNKRYNPALPEYWANDYAANFQDFLNEAPKDKPFFFWCGTIQPHLPWVKGAGAASGKSQGDAQVPAWLPDHPTVRNDVLDYNAETEYADAHLGRILKMLEEAGELENTIIIVTGDHGTPLPRAKCNLYDAGTHVPLIAWQPSRFKGGRVAEDLVSLVDVTPTILELAGVKPTEAMTGRSLKPLLESEKSGVIDPTREFVVTAMERHTWCRAGGVGYPMRAIRTADYLYIRNYEPDRWPQGDPDFNSAAQGIIGDSDSCPTKTVLIQQRQDPAIGKFYDLAYGKRPGEELYDVRQDPAQLHNLASNPAMGDVKQKLRTQLEQHLTTTADPRMRGETPWDAYPYYGDKGQRKK